MSDPRKQSAAILLRVAEFLQSLPEEHLAELEAGTASLTIIPAGATEPLKRTAPRPRAAKAAAVDVNKIAEAIRTAETREEAITLLRPLRKDPDLKEVAALLNVTGMGNLSKDRLINAIVEATVGSRLDFRAIQGDATLPY